LDLYEVERMAGILKTATTIPAIAFSLTPIKSRNFTSNTTTRLWVIIAEMRDRDKINEYGRNF